MNRRTILKYNEDDLLELVIEYLAERNGYETFNARASFLGIPGKDLRAIIVIGNGEDREVRNENLEDIDKKIEYNGSHANAKYITDISILERKLKEKDF